MNDAERVAALHERLGTSFPDPARVIAALTHKSYANEHPGAGAHNERLEFLGDAVVDLAVSHRLMERFPAAQEGELSRLRAMLVNEQTLAAIARELELGELLLLGKGEERSGGRKKASVLADALEAVIGVAYQGLGMVGALALVDRCFGERISQVELDGVGRDFKTRLQERVQREGRSPPRYQVVGQSGPEHDKQFEVEVSVGDQVFGRATGRSKKEAEQAAAQKTLAMLEEQDKSAP